MSNNCTNCDTFIPSEPKYCSHCGQKQDALNRPFGKVVADTLHESLDIDGRILLTLKTLLFKPGKITYDYNRGKRQTYTPPLRMYLVISILFFLFISQFDISTNSSTKDIARIYDYFPKFMILLLPVFALILQLMFKRTFYISNLIFSVHFHCFVYICLAILLPLESYEANSMWLLLPQLPISCYLLYYIAKAIKLNYAQSWGKTIAKTSLLLTIHISLTVSALEFAHLYIL